MLCKRPYTPHRSYMISLIFIAGALSASITGNLSTEFWLQKSTSSSISLIAAASATPAPGIFILVQVTLFGRFWGFGLLILISLGSTLAFTGVKMIAGHGSDY